MNIKDIVRITCLASFAQLASASDIEKPRQNGEQSVDPNVQLVEPSRSGLSQRVLNRAEQGFLPPAIRQSAVYQSALLPYYRGLSYLGFNNTRFTKVISNNLTRNLVGGDVNIAISEDAFIGFGIQTFGIIYMAKSFPIGLCCFVVGQGVVNLSENISAPVKVLNTLTIPAAAVATVIKIICNR